MALLSAPLEKYKDVVVVLKLGNYAKVMEHLDYDTNRVMAVVLIQSILANNTLITAPDKVCFCWNTISFWSKTCKHVGLTIGLMSFFCESGMSFPTVSIVLKTMCCWGLYLPVFRQLTITWQSSLEAFCVVVITVTSYVVEARCNNYQLFNFASLHRLQKLIKVPCILER